MPRIPILVHRKKQFRFVGFLAGKRKNTVRVKNTVRDISVCLDPAGGPVRRFIPDDVRSIFPKSVSIDIPSVQEQ